MNNPLIGTMLLIIFGDGIVANVVLSRTKRQNSGWMVIATGWGIAVAVGAYASWPISGAHLNPAARNYKILELADSAANPKRV